MENQSENTISLTININKIVELIDIGLSQVNLVEQNNVILLFGSTGSGKSLFANYINGRNITQKIIDCMNVLDIDEGEVADFEIGHNKVSQTQAIKTIKLGSSNNILCDIPGFFDNRSYENEIANSIVLTKFFSMCQSLQPIFLINYNDFEAERGNSFKKLLGIIINLFKKSDESTFNQCVFLFTHVPSDENTDFINHHLIQYIRGLNKEEETYTKLHTFLLNMLKQINQYSDLLIFKPLTKQQDKYFELIGIKQKFSIIDDEFNLSLSHNAQIYIINCAKDTLQQITSFLRENQYENAIQLLKSFKKVSSYLKEYEELQQIYQSTIKTVQQFIEINVREIINNFSQHSMSGNILSKKVIDEIILIKDQLYLLDCNSSEYFDSFQFTPQLLSPQLYDICEKISNSCQLYFTQDIQQMIIYFKNIFITKEIFPQIIDKYNECKDKLIVSYLQKSSKLQTGINNFFERENNNNKDDIKQIEVMIIEFEKIEIFLKQYCEEISLNESQKLKQHLKFKCLQILDDINIEMKNRYERIQQINKQQFGQINSDQFIPNLQLQTLKQFYTSNFFKENLFLQELWNEGVNKIKNEIISELKHIEDIIQESNLLSILQPFLVSIDNIINIDEEFQDAAKNYQDRIYSQLIQKIIQSREIALSLLEKYSSQLEDFIPSIQEITNLSNQQQKEDFRKLNNILEFLKKMKWIDNYYKRNVVQASLSLVKEASEKYKNNLFTKSYDLAGEYKYSFLNYYIEKILLLSKIQELLEVVSEEKDKFFEQMSNIINEKLIIIKDQFTQIQKQIHLNNTKGQEQLWLNFNNEFKELLQIEELKYIPYIKDQCLIIKKNIISNLREYNIINFMLVTNKKKLQESNDQSSQKNSTIFLQNFEFITNQCPDLLVCFEKEYNLSKIKDAVKYIFDDLFEEYKSSESELQLVNYQNLKNNFVMLKQYIMQFNDVRLFQKEFSSFQSLINPQLTIIEKLKNIEQLIRKNEFINMTDILIPFMNLEDEHEKTLLNNIFLQIYNKIKTLIYELEQKIKYSETSFDQKLIFQIKDDLAYINSMRDIYRLSIDKNSEEKIQIKLFSSLNMQLKQFLQSLTMAINIKAQQLKFFEIEEDYNNIYQFIRILDQNNLLNDQGFHLRLLNQLDHTINHLLKTNLEILSNPKKFNLFISNLEESIVRGNQTFAFIYANVNNKKEEHINEYIESQIENIQFNEDDIFFQKQKWLFNRIQQFLELLKEKNINYCQSFHLKLLNLEEQLQVVYLKKIRQFKSMLKYNQNQELILEIKQQKIIDRDLYNQYIQIMKKMLTQLVDISLNQMNDLEFEEFRENLKKIKSICEVSIEILELKQTVEEIQNQFLNNISQRCKQYLISVVNALDNSSFSIREVNFSDLFKLKSFFSILLQYFADEQIKQLFIEIKSVEEKLISCLKNLKDDQQNFFSNNHSRQIDSSLKIRCKQFEQLILQIKQEQFDQQFISVEVLEIVKQLHSLENLLESISGQPTNIEQEMQSAWNGGDYKKIKTFLDQLNSKKQISEQLNSQIERYNKAILSIEDNIEEITNEIISTLRNKKEFNQRVLLQINRLYQAQQVLINENYFNLKLKSQIKLIQDQVLKYIEEIQQQYQTVHGLIEIENISFNINQFNKLVFTKNQNFLQNYHQTFGNEGIFNLSKHLFESNEGRCIINKYSIFKFQKIQQFNEGLFIENDNQILDLLKESQNSQYQMPLNNSSKNQLQFYLQLYQSQYDDIMKIYINKNEEQWEQIALDTIKSMKYLSINQQNWDEQSYLTITLSISLVCAYWSLIDGPIKFLNQQNIEEIMYKKPTPIQILSILMFLGFNENLNLQNVRQSTQLKNKLIEIQIGEGKSFVIALLGCNVDILCYNDYLSTRDQDGFSDLFNKFKISDQINYGTLSKFTRQFIKQGGTVQLTSKIQQNQLIDQEQNSSQNCQRILLIDEIDSFLDMNVDDQPLQKSLLFTNQNIESIIKIIWEERINDEQILFDFIQQSSYFKDLSQEFSCLINYFQSQICLLIKCVKVIRDHEIKNNSNNFTFLTLFQYYCENLSFQTNNQNSQSIGFIISSLQLFHVQLSKYYMNVQGVTGFIQMNSEGLRNILKIHNISHQIFTPSIVRKKQNQDFDNTIQIKCNQNDHKNQINEIIEMALKNKRSAIVFFDSDKHMNNYIQGNQFYETNKSNITEINSETTFSNLKNIIHKSTQSWQITLCIKQYGRGTSFTCLDPYVLNNGGVIIIQTFLSHSQLEEMQIKGRMGIQSQKNNYYLILNNEDLKQQFEKEQSYSLNNISEIRNKIEEEKCQQLYELILQNSENQVSEFK